MGAQKPDFSGWATKAGLKCTDGRTIMKDAFAHQDKVTVPLVWAHDHDNPENVLGKVTLEHRDEGVFCYGYFNESVRGQSSKIAVKHGDLDSLSIYANQLIERSKQVLHGAIKEVSLVLAGANPGAKIMSVALDHGDGTETALADEAVIFTGLKLETGIEHSEGDETEEIENEGGEIVHASIEEVYNTFTDDQKAVVDFMVGAAFDAAGGKLGHSDEAEETDEPEETEETEEGGEPTEPAAVEQSPENFEGNNEAGDGTDNTNSGGDLGHQEGDNMSRNTFDQNGVSGATGTIDRSKALSHDDLVKIVKHAKTGIGFKEAVLAHAQEYGIENIDLLFPDAKALTETPEWISRRMEWVSVVLGGTKHSPFAKVKTLLADITPDEARAKGYVKGKRKVEEVFALLKRTTGPATIYKKQKLDRDDMLDITDMDVVAYLKGEMRLMIEEEIARAILVGDGRSNMSDDKVKDPAGATDGTGIRSILKDDDLYSIKVPLTPNVSPKDSVKELVRARVQFRGSGKPTLFASDAFITEIMLEEDKFGRPLYETEQALVDKLRVDKIVTVDLFEEYEGLVAIMVNLVDYTVGSNRGGELTSFEDFDIDFNQYKYLQETRLSGGLTKPYSAIVVTRSEGELATATAPSFDGTTNTITVPTATGVVYTINDEAVTGDVTITSMTEVEAHADEGYYLANGTTRTWTYTP